MYRKDFGERETDQWVFFASAFSAGRLLLSPLSGLNQSDKSMPPLFSSQTLCLTDLSSQWLIRSAPHYNYCTVQTVHKAILTSRGKKSLIFVFYLDKRMIGGLLQKDSEKNHVGVHKNVVY